MSYKSILLKFSKKVPFKNSWRFFSLNLKDAIKNQPTYLAETRLILAEILLE